MSPRRASTEGTGKLRRKIGPGDTERVAVWLTRAIAMRLRLHATRHRMSLSVAVEEAVRDYLERKGA
jgi:hypothetical protein